MLGTGLKRERHREGDEQHEEKKDTHRTTS